MSLKITIRLAMAFAAMMLLYFGASTPALAQYPCSGPGPGEIVVGQTPGNPSQAPMQLCQYVGGEDEGSFDEGAYDGPSRGPSGPRYAPSSMATATHHDTSVFWGTAGHRSPEAARQRVMEACAAVMGAGCVDNEAWTGDTVIAIAVDGFGGIWLEGEATRTEAERSAVRECEEHVGVSGCSIAFSFRNVLIPAGADPNEDYTEDYFPRGPVQRRRWALHAWPESPPSSWAHMKSWIMTGGDNFTESRQALLDRCQAEVGSPCVLGAAVTNGVLIQYANRWGQSGWLGAPGAAKAPGWLRAACRADEAPCRVLELFDAMTPGLRVVETPPLTRGFVSVAWPKRDGWRRLAIVTDRPTVEEANADALALCEAQSQQSCDLYLDHPDSRGATHMGLFSLPEDRLHIIFGDSVAGVNARAAQASQAAGVEYALKAMVDLTERAELTPAY